MNTGSCLILKQTVDSSWSVSDCPLLVFSYISCRILGGQTIFLFPSKSEPNLSMEAAATGKAFTIGFLSSNCMLCPKRKNMAGCSTCSHPINGSGKNQFKNHLIFLGYFQFVLSLWDMPHCLSVDLPILQTMVRFPDLSLLWLRRILHDPNFCFLFSVKRFTPEVYVRHCLKSSFDIMWKFGKWLHEWLTHLPFRFLVGNTMHLPCSEMSKLCLHMISCASPCRYASFPDIALEVWKAGAKWLTNWHPLVQNNVQTYCWSSSFLCLVML